MDPFLTNLHLRLHSQNGFLSPRYPASERSHSPQPADPVPRHDSPSDAHNKYGFPDAPDINAQNNEDKIDIPMFEKPPVVPGLKEAVRGLYHMWKGSSDTKNEEDFINIVRDALFS